MIGFFQRVYQVVNKEGGLAANFGFGGGEEQRLRLAREGVKFTAEGKVKMKEYQYWLEVD